MLTAFYLLAQVKEKDVSSEPLEFAKKISFLNVLGSSKVTNMVGLDC